MLTSLKLAWCRSYAEEQTLHFDPRLTLIEGHNGAGKTTLLESLKAATIGVFPPNSESGRTFVANPKLVGKTEVTGSLNLSIKSVSGTSVQLIRAIVVVDRKSKLEVKKAVNLIKTGDKVRASKLGEMNSAVPNLLGVSSAVLENISFCHQEQALWPFTESGELKRIMDEIFETERFTKVQDALAKLVKQKKTDISTLTVKLDCKQVLLKQLEAEDGRHKQSFAELAEIEKAQDEKKTYLHKLRGELDQLEALKLLNDQRDMRRLEIVTYESIMNSMTNSTQMRSLDDIAFDIEIAAKLAAEEAQQQANLQQATGDLTQAVKLLEKDLTRLRFTKSSLEAKRNLMEARLQGRTMEAAALYYLEEKSKVNERIAEVTASSATELHQLAMSREDLLSAIALLTMKKQDAEASRYSASSTLTQFTFKDFKGKLLTCKASNASTRWVLDIVRDPGVNYSQSCEMAETDTESLQEYMTTIDLLALELPSKPTEDSVDLAALTQLSLNLEATSNKVAMSDQYQTKLDTLETELAHLSEMNRVVKENYRNRLQLDQQSLEEVCSRFEEILSMTDIEGELSGVNQQLNDSDQDMTWLTYKLESNRAALTKLNTSSLALRLRELRREEEDVKRKASLTSNADKIAFIKQEIERLNRDLSDFDMPQLNLIRQQFRSSQKDFDESQGKVELLRSQLKLYSPTQLQDARRDFNLITLERDLGSLAIHEFEDLAKAIERGVIEFHNHKLNEVNSLLQELWSHCYKGTDIEGLQLRADQVESTKFKHYNYRLVCRVADHWMDMKGRCSAGQKMLASILLRVALAQAFSADCGILALDEPTMNLDRENALGLAEMLGKLSSVWPKLQLIVITHDRDFSAHLLRLSERNEYYRVQRIEGSSVLELIH